MKWKWLNRMMIAGTILAVFAVGMVACGDVTEGESEQLSEPTAFTMQVDGYSLTCVSIVGYSNYGGGISCDWETWRELKDGGY